MALIGEPIVVLGTFRGGTSCLSTALGAMGMYMGEPNAFQKANEFNKGGFWELEDMQALNSRLLQMYGLGYLGADHMPEDWLDRPGSDVFLRDAQVMLHKHFQGKENWGWKEPGTTSLFPFYKEVLSREKVEPRYAIIVRHPLSVAFSRKRQFEIKNADVKGVQNLIPPDEQRALGLWVDYMLTNLLESKGRPRFMLCYEDLLENPALHLQQMADNLLPWKPSSEQMNAAIETINPEWSHSRFALSDLEGLPAYVARTYDICLRAASDPKGFQEGKYDEETEALWNEWLATSYMIRSFQMPAGKLILSWREGETLKHSDQAFTPTGGWQTVRCKISAPPGVPIQVTPYQMPCQMWIKRAVWVVDGQDHPAALQMGPNGILEQAGMLRLTSFGSGSLSTKMPPTTEEAEFVIDFLLQFDISALNAVVVMMRNRMESMRRAAPR